MSNTQTSERKASFNYLAASIPPSLFRNGRVYLRRLPDGTDEDIVGYEEDARMMVVHDARTEALGRRGLHVNGFALVEHDLPANAVDFLNHEDVVRRHYPDCQALLREVTGAEHVFAFDHNVRWAVGEKQKRQTGEGQQVQKPIRLVHGDYTLTSGPQRLRDLADPPRINDTMRPFLEGGAVPDPLGAGRQGARRRRPFRDHQPVAKHRGRAGASRPPRVL